MKQSEKLTIPSGILFLFAAAIILISIFLQFLNFGSFRTFPLSALYNFGRMLFSVYGYSSFLIPIFLFISAIMLFLPNWSTARGIYLLVSIIPFFTIAGLEYASKIILTDVTLPMKVMKYTAVVFISALLVSIEYLITGLIIDAFSSKKGKKAAYVPVFEVNDEGNPIPEEILKKTDETTSEKEKPVKKATDTTTKEKGSIKEIDISDITADEENFEPVRKEKKVKKDVEDDYKAQDLSDSNSEIPDEIPNFKQPETISNAQVNELSSIVPGFSDNDDIVDETLEEEELVPEVTEETSDDTVVSDEQIDISQEEAPEEEVASETEEQPETDYSAEVVEEPVPLESEEQEKREPLSADTFGVVEDPAALVGEKEAEKADPEPEIITIDFDAGKKQEPEIITLDFNSDDAPELKLLKKDEPDIIPDEPVTAEDFYSPEEEAFFQDPFADEASADSGADAETSATEEAYEPEENPAAPAVTYEPAETPKPTTSASYTSSRYASYHIPTEGLLNSFENNPYWIIDDETRQAGSVLKETLSEFKIEAEITGIRKGPVITMFEILPAPGVRLNKIVALQDNIALRLAAASVRIVAPIPGKQAVGVEIPNRERAMVSFRELIEKDLPAFKKMQIPVVLGKDITGEAQMLDLTATPHLLIAGSTGSGKSVCVNSIILSILYKRSPRDVKMILIDPKVVELKLYNDIPHLLTPVITEPKKAFQALQYCLCEMERRYAMLDRMGVRDIKTYNRRIDERQVVQEKLPYIVVIIDEFADLMATTGKELENTVARLAAMSRAVGIHLVLATQRPSIDVITGLIKANIPTRIAFMVASKTDSRIIIDQVGAEKLLGKGDMLYASAIDPFPVRIQGTFVTEDEVENVVDYVKQFGPPDYIDDEIFVEEEDDEDGESQGDTLFTEGEDPLYEQALDIVVQAGKASASYIQRRLKIGYNRAARLVEEMEDRGIVGPANGAKPREIIHIP